VIARLRRAIADIDENGTVFHRTLRPTICGCRGS
jgi:hypothetical protein